VFDGTVTDRSDFNTATFGDDDTDGDGTSFKAAIISGSNFNAAIFNNADLTNAVARCLSADCASFVNATFTDSILENANFQDADLSGTQFITSDLTGADFGDSIFSATTSFGTSQIDGLDLVNVNLDAADPDLFQNITPGPELTDPSNALGVNLAGTDLSDFNFANLALHNWSFNGADIAGANFTGADLNGALLTGIAFTTVLETLTTDNDFFAGTNLNNADLRALDLAGNNFTSTNLSGAQVSGASFVDANFTNANLTNLDDICDINSVCAEITGATLNCVNFNGSNPTDFDVRDVGDEIQADEDFFQFVSSDLEGVKLPSRSFLGYDLSSLKLAGADLNFGQFRGADLRGTDLSGANLTDATFCDTVAGGTCSTFGDDTDDAPAVLTTLSDPLGLVDLINSVDCNEHEAVNLTRANFSNAPRDLFEETITGDSVACVNFTNADLSTDDLAMPTRGFDFDDLTDWEGAVLAGANLRFQDFATNNTDDRYQDFFLQLSRAKTANDICTDADDNVDDIAPGADLSSVVFSCGDLTGQRMSTTEKPADLRDTMFVRTTIGGTGFSFEGAQIDGINFSNVDFSDESLVNVFQDVDTVKLNGSDEPFEDEDGIPYPNLQNLNLSFANLSSDSPPFNLEHVDLTGARLDGTNFTNANLTNAILDDIVSLCGAQPQNPSAPDPCLPLNNPTPTCMTIVGATLTGASLQGTDFTSLIFEETVPNSPDGEFFQVVKDKNLRGVDFTGSAIAGFNFSGMDLTDSIISTAQRICDSSIIPGEDGCANFKNAKFGSSEANAPLSFLTLNPDFDRFNFRGSNLVGATFTNVNLVNVEFDDIENICETVDPEPTDCLTITGPNSSLFGSNFEGLDVKLIDFGEPDAGGIIDFQLVNFTLADFSTTSLTKRNMRGANFTGANLQGADFSGSILAEIVSGCTGSTCTSFDDTTLRGVNAEGARIEGTFNNVDASPVAASIDEPEKPSLFDSALFIGVDLSTADFSQASMEGATFDSDVLFCVDTACVNFEGASLIAGNMRGLNFDHALSSLFADINNHDLSQVDFTGSDISDKVFMDTKLDFADLSQTDLRGVDFRNASFIETEFARGGVTDGDVCTLRSGGSRVDLRGADLRGADLSRARNFQAGCILVDATTLYDHSTKFPAGFALLDTITIPEPSRGLLQVTALLSLAALLRRRRSRGIQ